MKLVDEQDDRPIVLIPEPGFAIPWQELVSIVSGKRIVDEEPMVRQERIYEAVLAGSRLSWLIISGRGFELVDIGGLTSKQNKSIVEADRGML